MVAFALKGQAEQVGNKIVVKYSNGCRVRLVCHQDTMDIDLIIPIVQYHSTQTTAIIRRHLDANYPMNVSQIPNMAVMVSQTVPIVPVISAIMQNTMRNAA